MKLKLDDKGAVVVQDGKPVYIADDGKEIAFDVAGTVQTIGRLNSEAKGHRERAEAAETKLAAYAGIDDPKKALDALKTVSNLDFKKLVDAGEAEKAKTEAIKATEEKYVPIVKERDGFRAALHEEKIGGGFARSKFIAEKLVLPADIAQARFGSAFKIEDGKVVAYDPAGNKIYSKGRPGELADFDEALETIVDQYPYKANILKAPGSSGGGAPGSRGNGAAGGDKTMTRAEFVKLDPVRAAAVAKDHVITDA
jgi:hypothetical protein